MIVLPLFHVGGTLAVFAMLARGGSVAIIEAFDTKSIWRLVRATETTVLVLLGVMAHFLSKEPVGPEDREHPVRKVIMVPVQDAGAFSERFGVDVYTVFNMTEISSPVISGRNPPVNGSCGRKREGVDVRLVDENDVEVAPDTVGELIVRTDRPWAMNHGYYRDAEATARAWRNGWFHTGDAFRVDKDGNYFFVDRIKDVIRRRGENISSFEVETEVCTHPAVKEAAAVAVPSDVSEDEVLVAISLMEGEALDPMGLVTYLIPRMAYFSVPRFIRILSQLPKTPTQKILKHVLRNEGVTPDTWDREKAGVRLSRERFRTTTGGAF
jgi:carnitine-CoA ligase